jgi:hypothetical protein
MNGPSRAWALAVPEAVTAVEALHARARARPAPPASLRQCLQEPAAAQVDELLPPSSAPERHGFTAADLRPQGGVSLATLLGLPPEAFVAAAYRRLLGREADRAGWQHAVAALQAGQRPIDLLADLASSDEGRQVRADLRGLDFGSPILRICRKAWRRVAEQAARRSRPMPGNKGEST